MPLKVLGDKPLYLETGSEVHRYLDALFTQGLPLKSFANIDFQVVEDVSADRIAHKDMSVPDNVLSIGVDYSSGYGGLLWYCDGRLVDRVAAAVGADVASYVWVSLNPTPPESDPKVLSDPSCPSFFDRISALPVPAVRSTVEEFFHEGTGFRPTQIQWAKGNFTGELCVEEDEA
ncbi:Imm1 family immunity protein [Streptomyces sp. NPDC052236]|uniref:Imm1 family immunity protein n=1 Tax=Streptomyces sp. NPDC052236 TaxID=3365686 RepID=UPI0037CE43C7